jgi:hypothetical protein
MWRSCWISCFAIFVLVSERSGSRYANEMVQAAAYPIAMDGDTIDQISARLVNYQFTDGYVIVTLDNGQMWRETAGGEPLQHLARPALSYAAVIGRGGGGSYALKLTGISREIPVRRIRELRSGLAGSISPRGLVDRFGFRV